MMTEHEAKTKICQETFLLEGGPYPCIGAACMAWRWGTEPLDERAVPTSEIDRWKISGWTVKVAGSETCVMVSAGVGYCGRAGRL